MQGMKNVVYTTTFQILTKMIDDIVILIRN